MSLSDFVSSSNLLNASWISESSYLPASTGTQPNSVWITAETSSAGGRRGRVWCIICPLHSYHIHSPGPACTTPNCLVWDSCTLCTPSWLPLILEMRLLDWMQVAWFGYTMHYGSGPWTSSPATARCGPSLPSVQTLKSYIWVALFIALAGNILE